MPSREEHDHAFGHPWFDQAPTLIPDRPREAWTIRVEGDEPVEERTAHVWIDAGGGESFSSMRDAALPRFRRRRFMAWKGHRDGPITGRAEWA